MICVIVIIPIACLLRMHIREQTEIQVIQVEHPREIIVLPPLLISLLSTFIFLSCDMNIQRTQSIMLVTIYVFYLAFTYVNTCGQD